MGVYLREVMDSTAPTWLKTVFALASKLIYATDPEWAGEHKDYVVQCSQMQSTNGDYCEAHVDNKNMCWAYGVTLGKFTGGDLVCNDRFGTPIAHNMFHTLTRFEGRREHYVAPFVGTRYNIIWYKKYDRRWKKPRPIGDGAMANV